MSKLVKLDPTKITYDGKGFHAVIMCKKEFEKKLNKLRREVLKDILRKNNE